jgi:hypothetical protein
MPLNMSMAVFSDPQNGHSLFPGMFLFPLRRYVLFLLRRGPVVDEHCAAYLSAGVLPDKAVKNFVIHNPLLTKFGQSKQNKDKNLAFFLLRQAEKRSILFWT